MTRSETDITASDFAGYTRCTEPKLGSKVKPRHDRAPFIDGRTGYPFDVSVKAVEGGEATTSRDSTTSTQPLCGVMPRG